MQKLLAVAFLGALCAVPALAATGSASTQILQQRTADGRLLLTDRPAPGAKTERSWQVEREDPAAARQRAIDVKAEANLVSRTRAAHARSATPCRRRCHAHAHVDRPSATECRRSTRRTAAPTAMAAAAAGCRPSAARARSVRASADLRITDPIAPPGTNRPPAAAAADLADQDRPEVVDVGERRAGHDQVAEAGEEREGVVAIEMIASAQTPVAGRAPGCRA